MKEAMRQGCGEAHAGGWPIFLSGFCGILFFYDQVLVRGRPREGQEVRPGDLRTLVQESPVLRGPDVLLPLSPGKRRMGGFGGTASISTGKKGQALGWGGTTQPSKQETTEKEGVDVGRREQRAKSRGVVEWGAE